jgi:transcription-repair coupling factor (superfamily II helicase)
MNLQHLLNKFQGNPRLFSLADNFLCHPAAYLLKKPQWKQQSIRCRFNFNNSITAGLNHLVVLNDAEEAAYFHNTLESITKALDLFYFHHRLKTERILSC